MSIARVSSLFLMLSLAAVQPAVSQNQAQSRPFAGPRDALALLQHRVRSAALPPTGSRGSAPSSAISPLIKTKIYQFASADFPGAEASIAYDRSGPTVVGGCVLGGGGEQAFTFRGGNYELLVPPGSVAAIATGITSTGEIVGAYGDTSGVVHGFIDNAGTFTSVDFPGATGTAVFQMNASGIIVGGYTDTTGNDHGFVDNAGTFTSIDYPGTTSGTEATGIDSAGDIVGSWSSSTAPVTGNGFLLSGGVFTPINFPAAATTTAFGINDSGEISGYFQDAAMTYHGFIFANGNWSQIDVAGASGTQLAQIKNNHNITGIYFDSSVGMETHGLTGH